MKPKSHLVPVLAAACGIATFSVMDALMKGASMQVGVFSALMWRCVLGAGMCFPAWWVMERGRIVWPSRAMLGIHAFRSALVLGMASLFFWGLVRTPMAVGMALSFISPLIALYLSALFLGEAVTRRALGASLIALMGVGVIAAGRLSGGFAHSADSRAGLVAILCAAVLYAGNLVVQRHQAQRASPGEIAFFQSLFVALFMAPLSPWLGVMPGHGGFGWSAMGWVVAAAGLASISVGLLSWGWARAEAHRLLPVEYSAFVWSALAGWWWFGERPSGATLGGVVLIVAGVWFGTVSRGANRDGLPGELGAPGA
jgi:S-adenosylmethionine uptake transporter